MPDGGGHGVGLTEWKVMNWRVARTGALLAGVLIEGDIQRIVALGVSAVDHQPDDAVNVLCRLVRRPRLLNGQFVLGQGTCLVGGNGGDDADGLDGAHLMHQRLFGGHPPHA